jgi:hypothetical protein
VCTRGGEGGRVHKVPWVCVCVLVCGCVSGHQLTMGCPNMHPGFHVHTTGAQVRTRAHAHTHLREGCPVCLHEPRPDVLQERKGDSPPRRLHVCVCACACVCVCWQRARQQALNTGVNSAAMVLRAALPAAGTHGCCRCSCCCCLCLCAGVCGHSWLHAAQTRPAHNHPHSYTPPLPCTGT